jgi:hypothetical protein
MEFTRLMEPFRGYIEQGLGSDAGGSQPAR